MPTADAPGGQRRRHLRRRRRALLQRRFRRHRVQIAITVFVTLLAVVGVLVVRQYETVRAAGTEPDYRPLPAPYQPPRVAWLGDSYTGGSDMGGRGEQNYSAIVSRAMRWRDVNEGQGGTGYLAGDRRYSFGSDNRLARLAERGRYDIVFVVNGFNDYKYPESETYAAVRRTLLRLHEVLSPDGKVVVVGYFPLRHEDTYVTRRNAEIGRAARDTGALFVDPSGTGWLTGKNYTTYIGADTYHPSDLGHRFLAEQLTKRFDQLDLNRVVFHPAPSYGPLPGLTPLSPSPSTRS